HLAEKSDSTHSFAKFATQCFSSALLIRRSGQTITVWRMEKWLVFSGTFVRASESLEESQSPQLTLEPQVVLMGRRTQTSEVVYLYLIRPPNGARHDAVSPSKIVMAGDSEHFDRAASSCAVSSPTSGKVRQIMMRKMKNRQEYPFSRTRLEILNELHRAQESVYNVGDTLTQVFIVMDFSWCFLSFIEPGMESTVMETSSMRTIPNWSYKFPKKSIADNLSSDSKLTPVERERLTEPQTEPHHRFEPLPNENEETRANSQDTVTFRGSAKYVSSGSNFNNQKKFGNSNNNKGNSGNKFPKKSIADNLGSDGKLTPAERERQDKIPNSHLNPTQKVKRAIAKHLISGRTNISKDLVRTSPPNPILKEDGTAQGAPKYELLRGAVADAITNILSESEQTVIAEGGKAIFLSYFPPMNDHFIALIEGLTFLDNEEERDECTTFIRDTLANHSKIKQLVVSKAPVSTPPLSPDEVYNGWLRSLYLIPIVTGRSGAKPDPDALEPEEPLHDIGWRLYDCKFTESVPHQKKLQHLLRSLHLSHPYMGRAEFRTQPYRMAGEEVVDVLEVEGPVGVVAGVSEECLQGVRKIDTPKVGYTPPSATTIRKP
ncbi:hypothetical protein EV361DRAFT_1021471, partial [Lentinula raphanica]